jgi:hypothetical protein
VILSLDKITACDILFLNHSCNGLGFNFFDLAGSVKSANFIVLYKHKSSFSHNRSLCSNIILNTVMTLGLLQGNYKRLNNLYLTLRKHV